MTLRNKVYRDALTWNFNCYLAKNYNKKCKQVFQTENLLFIQSMKDDKGIAQMSVVEFLSPTKMFVKENIYFKREFEEDEKLTRTQKLCKESETEWSADYLSKYKTYQLWDMEIKFKELIVEEIKFDEYLGYQKNPELRYALDFSDALVVLFCKMVIISQKFKII